MIRISSTSVSERREGPGMKRMCGRGEEGGMVIRIDGLKKLVCGVDRAQRGDLDIYRLISYFR